MKPFLLFFVSLPITVVYGIDSDYYKPLAYHRESVRCLVRVSANSFASASLDGSIVLWSADSLLTPMKVLNNPEQYRNQEKVYIYNVKYLLPLGDVMEEILFIYQKV